MKTLFVSDLDGTLLRDDTSLSPFSRHELTELLREGVPITIASARSIYSIKPILGDIPFRLPIIEANGAFITDYETGRKEVVRSIDGESAHTALDVMLHAGLAPFITGNCGTGDFLFYRDLSNPGVFAYVNARRAMNDPRLREIEDLRSVPDSADNRVTSISAIDTEVKILKIASAVNLPPGEDLVTTVFEYRENPGWYFFLLHHGLATKDHAIRHIRRAYGLEEATLVVFGDDANDEGMFRIADRALAPSNAKQAIKALAHEIIGTNQEDCVVRRIRSAVGTPPRPVLSPDGILGACPPKTS
jgi:Cof subfamily protein (haloacid dehalogenase superfamily)